MNYEFFFFHKTNRFHTYLQFFFFFFERCTLEFVQDYFLEINHNISFMPLQN
jgi:hypothetical protein